MCDADFTRHADDPYLRWPGALGMAQKAPALHGALLQLLLNTTPDDFAAVGLVLLW
jgi:hypothetical protein